MMRLLHRIFDKYAMYVLLAVLCVLAAACKSKQTEIVIVPDAQKNHLQRNHIFGKVKIITTCTCVSSYAPSETDTMSVDSLSLDTVSVYIQHYSADGYLLSAVSLLPSGDTVSVKNLAYLSDGRPDSCLEIDYVNHTKVVCRYEYDMNDFLTAEKWYQADSLLYSISYKTDGIGNVIEMQRHYNGYSVKNVSSYNENGLVVRIDEYDPTGKVYKYITIEYDNYGDEVNRRAFKGPNDIIEYTYKEYSQDGALKKMLFEDRLHHSKEQSVYSGHDEQKNWTVETRTKNKKLIYKRIRNYIYY